jgi:hypothetical protein
MGRGSYNDYEQTVYGVTNRTLDAQGRFTDKVDKEIHYFEQKIWFQDRADKDTIRTTTASHAFAPRFVTEEVLMRDVDMARRKNNQRVGVYVHGIRNAPDDAELKAAEMSAYSGQPFVVADWASTDPTKTDRNSSAAIGETRVA